MPIHLDNAETTTWVGDPGIGVKALLSVDLATGNRTIISDATTGSGQAFDHLWSMTVNNAETTAYVADSNDRILFAVDLATGNRTIISK